MTKNVQNKIHFTHLRNVGRKKRDNYTIAFQFRGDDVHVGVAKCSRRDQYNKKLGRTIAAGRLLKAMEGDDTDWSFTFYEMAELPKREIISVIAGEFGVREDYEQFRALQHPDSAVMYENDEPAVLGRAGE